MANEGAEVSAIAVAVCRCGHNKSRHDMAGFDGECVAGACTCKGFRPRTEEPVPIPVQRPVATAGPIQHAAIIPARPAPRQPNPNAGPTVDQILTAGRRSEFKRTVGLAEKITTLLVVLRERLHEERKSSVDRERERAQRAAALRDISDLERRLREAKARAGQTGDLKCPDCPRTFGRPQALGRHRSQAHGWVNPNTSHHKAPTTEGAQP